MSRNLLMGLIVAVAAVVGSSSEAFAQAAGSTYLINVDSTYSGDFDAVLSFTGPSAGFYTTGVVSLVADDLSIGAGAFAEYNIFAGAYTFVNAPLIVGDGYQGSFTAETTNNFIVAIFTGIPFNGIVGEGSGNVGDAFTFISY